MKVNSGQDKQTAVLANATTAGTTGTATATTATTLTNSGASWTTNQWAGRTVFAGSAYGVIVSNTATALTIDRWINPASPSGAAASTPSGTSVYVIAFGGAPVGCMGITANSTAPAATDTALAGEITTAGGGLIRQYAALAHTSGASSYTLTGTFTANGSDSLPVTVAKMGTFDTLGGATGIMLHETLVSPTATLSASGDQLTITQTVSM
jgi:hypothetical protein